MKYIKQFAIILSISFVGEILHYFIPLPVPASIYGIIILFTLLQFKIISLEKIKDAGNFLINIMPIMFVPAAVELMDTWHLISPSALQYIVIIFVSSLAVIVVSGLTTQILVRFKNKKGGKNND